MSVLCIIEHPESCPFDFSGVQPIAARSYLTEEMYAGLKGVKVFNICRSYRYQSIGYYVSLLAEARRHKPVPNMTTIQDMKSVGIIRLVSDELDRDIQRCLKKQAPNKFQLYVAFGKTLEPGFDSLASQLFKRFPTPFLRADFTHTSRWQLMNVSPLGVKEVSAQYRAFVEQVASAYFKRKDMFIPKRPVTRFDLAILHDPEEDHPPSDARAVKKFIKAAERLDMGTELITRDDSNRLSEFDALFIRTTTSVDHYTFRMARKAVAEGLVVIDDPDSILRCCNKVYLAECMKRHNIPIPQTLIVHSKNIETILSRFSLPCVLKQPDSSFSQGVILVRDREKLLLEAGILLSKSEMIIAQEYLPSDFDWRIGILDRQPLYACKYFMASKHWQIIRKEKSGRESYGRVEALPLERVPKVVLRTALKAANLMGDGLYGVDLKQVGRKAYIIEVNDNPSIEAGYEDTVMQDELYHRVMDVFVKRIEARVFKGRQE